MTLKGSLMVEREQRKGKISKGVELGSHLSGKTRMEAVVPAELEEGLLIPLAAGDPRQVVMKHQREG